ncbi:hypothetical protein [Georgenia deserti]|uniref:Uncharacterized protein n=1 Tax=Georgenia deserti TaxID=2093781 RepID=A0ABW4L313_9MICO
MKDAIGRLARRIAPRTMTNLETISRWDSEYEDHGPRIVVYERELRELRREVDAMRREQRRVVELYDAVFEHARRTGASADGSDAVAGHGPDESGRGA